MKEVWILNLESGTLIGYTFSDRVRSLLWYEAWPCVLYVQYVFPQQIKNEFCFALVDPPPFRYFKTKFSPNAHNRHCIHSSPVIATSGVPMMNYCRMDPQESENFLHLMTSSNGNILRITGPLWGEFTDHRFWCFLWRAPEHTIE